MRKIIKLIAIVVLVGFIWGMKDLLLDKQNLKNNVIRLHVVANSDSEEDQQIKLQLKDAIVNYLQPILENISSKEEAMSFVRENLESLKRICIDALAQLGVCDEVVITLQKETFLKRVYDTFSLPAGVYDALRIQIGNGEGKNWWCVVFPSLCLPAAGTDLQDAAVSAGFSETLTNTIDNSGKYRIRFFFLDCLGKLENLFYKY